MSAKGLARRLLNLPLKPLGLKLARRGTTPPGPARASGPTSSDRLAHLARIGFNPKVIYDCGAYKGHWAAEMAARFPGAQLVLVEPNHRLYPTIRQSTANVSPKPILVEAAAGENEGTAELNVWGNEENPGAGSSLLSHVQGNASQKIQVKLVTIDSIVRDFGLGPEFLKLDLQGFELPALKGATQALQTAELCEIEFGVLEAYVGRTSPRDLMNFMYDHRFTLYDIVDLIYRPYDGALTGGDFFFVKTDSPLRSYGGYS